MTFIAEAHEWRIWHYQLSDCYVSLVHWVGSVRLWSVVWRFKSYKIGQAVIPDVQETAICSQHMPIHT